MLIEQTERYKTPGEGKDLLAGWQQIPGFVVGYLKPNPSIKPQKGVAVGIFHVAVGDLKATQSRVLLVVRGRGRAG